MPRPLRYDDPTAHSHDEAGAEELAIRALASVGLPSEVRALAELRRGEGGKILVAVLLRKHTSAGNRWLAQRRAMGHSGSVNLTDASGQPYLTPSVVVP